jgi:hypothetical protein
MFEAFYLLGCNELLGNRVMQVSCLASTLKMDATCSSETSVDT